jgi:branched-subunit amino acid transport protein
MSFWEAVLCIAGLTLITIATRGFFLLPRQELPIPAWLREGLRYAPLGALAAVAVPEIVYTQGQFISSWHDPKLYATLAGTAWYLWRRTLLGTIVCGTGVMLLLRLGLGW